MIRYVLLKLGRALFVVWAAFTLTFVLLYVFPADPIDLLFDPAELKTVSQETRDQVAALYGFDKPVALQYVDRLWHALQGDFGSSVQTGTPVVQAIVDVLPSTLVLSAGALVLAVGIAFAIALAATLTRRPWLRNLVESIPPATVSVPVFLLGIVMIHVFSFTLGWFPSFGDGNGIGLVLPLVTLAIPVSGPIAQLLVRSFETEAAAPYVTTSQAKGASRPWIIVKDVVRNASLPAFTIAGITFGNLIAGSVIIETIFSRGGLGRLTQTSINTLDIPVVQGIVVFVAASFAAINLLVDFLYPVIDPRLRASLATGPRPTALAGAPA